MSGALARRRGPLLPGWLLWGAIIVIGGAVLVLGVGVQTVSATLYRPLPLLFGQLLLGLINGAFYALLSLGLAVIFGMLNIINFAHGAFFMRGAWGGWLLPPPNTWRAMISPGLAV